MQSWELEKDSCEAQGSSETQEWLSQVCSPEMLKS